MKLRISLLALVLVAFTAIQPVLAQDPILPEDSCVQCFEESLLVGGTREDKCLFVLNHCSPCYYLVTFWCWEQSGAQAQVIEKYRTLPAEKRRRYLEEVLERLKQQQ